MENLANPRVMPAEGDREMAKNSGEGYRIGSVDDRTQVQNPVTGDWTKRDRDPDSKTAGKFMDVKSGGTPFKGVAKEPDRRRAR
jgi:hypothetical protein